MLALLLASAMAAAPAVATSLGPAPLGSTVLTMVAGRPFYSVRIDHGLFERADVGGGLDFASAGFLRPMAGVRVRLLSERPVSLALRAAGGMTIPTSNAGYGSRSVVRTWESELGLSADWPFAPLLSGYLELSLLGQTDFKAEHSASFGQALAGLEWAPGGPVSLLARGGVMQGSHGRALVGNAGVACRF
jgi:hypothetical protein